MLLLLREATDLTTISKSVLGSFFFIYLPIYLFFPTLSSNWNYLRLLKHWKANSYKKKKAKKKKKKKKERKKRKAEVS